MQTKVGTVKPVVLIVLLPEIVVGSDNSFLPFSTNRISSRDFLLQRYALFLCFKELQPHISGAGIGHTFPIGHALYVAVGASFRGRISTYGVSHRIVKVVANQAE